MRWPFRLRLDRLVPGLALASLLVAPVGAAEETLTITVDRARVVKVPPGAQTLVIGNPIIADVTLLKQSGTMIVTGKGFGETNLIALDASGNPVAESVIRVVSGTNMLVVQRGMERQSYTCAPGCQPDRQTRRRQQIFRRGRRADPGPKQPGRRRHEIGDPRPLPLPLRLLYRAGCPVGAGSSMVRAGRS